MPDHLLTRSTSGRGRGRRWIAGTLVGGGTAALIWCAASALDGLIAQQLAQYALSTARPAAPDTSPAPIGAANVRRPTAVRRGDPIAALWIPRIELSAVVLHGSDARTLRRGPGHLERTPLPGQPGNVVIAGHRDSFFRALRHIRRGDEIFLDAPAGRFRYVVTRLHVVEPRDLSVTEPTDEAVLTLFTCYPFWVLGDAPQRFVVRAQAVADGRPPTAVPRPLIPGTSAPEPPAVPDEARAVSPARPAEALTDVEHIRRAVERYRLSYNQQLRQRGHPSRASLVAEQRCTFTVNDDQATAVCENRAGTNDPLRELRTFALERAGDVWAIRGITVTQP